MGKVVTAAAAVVVVVVVVAQAYIILQNILFCVKNNKTESLKKMVRSKSRVSKCWQNLLKLKTLKY